MVHVSMEIFIIIYKITNFYFFLLLSVMSVLIIKTSFFLKQGIILIIIFIFYQTFDKVNIGNNLPSTIMVR